MFKREREKEMEMDEEKIGMVLVRASELRSKIANCIHKTTTNPDQTTPAQDQIDGDDKNGGANDRSSSMEADEEADEEAEVLLNICDAFDSLESQLNSLQALQQQQQYEREAVVADIENSRKMLLKKLGEYKGEHMDVIREAVVFAGMKVEHDNDLLLLPPYPTRGPHSSVLENTHLSQFSYTRKLSQNGHNNSDVTNERKNSETQTSSSKLWGGLRFLVHSTAKTMITLVGVISLLNLAGFEPRISKKGGDSNVLTLFQVRPDIAKKKFNAECPPGKIAVMEGSEIHCIVKERVEIPFDSVAENPDVNYGCG